MLPHLREDAAPPVLQAAPPHLLLVLGQAAAGHALVALLVRLHGRVEPAVLEVDAGDRVPDEDLGEALRRPAVLVLGQVGLERLERGVHLPLVQVAEREAVADRERRRPLRQGLLDVEEGPAGLLVVAPDEVLVREERADARARRADLVRPAEGGARLLRLVRALVDLAQDHLHEPLAGVVRGELLERRDRVLEVRSLVRAGDHHRVDEAPLAVRGLLREHDRLLEVLLVLGRRRHRREVVDAHRELRVGGHDLLRGRDRVRARTGSSRCAAGPRARPCFASADFVVHSNRLPGAAGSAAAPAASAAASPRKRMRFVIGFCSFPSTPWMDGARAR